MNFFIDVHPSLWSQSPARPSKWIMVLPTLPWRPSVPSSARVLQFGVCREEVCARLRPPRHSRCLVKRALQSLPQSHWHQSLSPAPHCTYCFFLAARSRWQDDGGSVSFTVTEPLPSLRPWRCVDVSLLPPCSCRWESLPRLRPAHRARSRAFGNLSTSARYCPTPIFVQLGGINSSLRRVFNAP